ncbi:MAG: DNA repair protein RecO C-terminal domain-containing protein [Flavobacteriales bacterium]|nr:DNA repair protein RecO C-terminal domain-containing protein [Flavobacteriales bacterium]
MLHTTRALVLRAIAHRDRMIVLKAYTEEFGLRSYLVRGSAKRGLPQALLQPLNRIELVVDERAERDLHHVRDMRLYRPYLHIHGDAVRGAVLLFLQEVLYRTLREEAGDAALFAFLDTALDRLDQTEDLRHFPLVFLLKYATMLGFAPEAPEAAEPYFDLQEGRFVHEQPLHAHAIGPPLTAVLAALLSIDLETSPDVTVPAAQRRELLDLLLRYLRLHVPGAPELRSPEVLHQLLT